MCVCVCVVEGLQTKHADRTRWLTPTEKKGGKKEEKKDSNKTRNISLRSVTHVGVLRH